MRHSIFLLLLCLIVCPARAQSDPPYATPNVLHVLSLLAPPPARGSAAEKRDINAVLEAQNARTPALEKHAIEDADASGFRFADVLGPNFTAKNLPLTAKLLAKVRSAQSALTAPAKDCFLGPRPFLIDPRVHPIAQLKAESANDPPRPLATLPRGPGSPCRALPETAPPAYSYSYPSGHAAFGALEAIILARMVPEKREALYARGWDFGWSRVVAGIHAPSALESSRIVATLLAEALAGDAGFEADLAAARAELRPVLGLAP
jgi:acid phosphatase (class A)